jgi:hypothetical protein
VDTELENQIRKVRKFGRYARALCILIAVLFAIIFVAALGNIAFGRPGTAGFTVGLGAYSIATDHISTPGARAWTITVIVAIFGFLYLGLFHLYRLFSNLAAGSIYTQDNVYRIRQLGLLALAGVVLQMLVAMSSQLLLQSGVFDAAMIVPNSGPRGGLVFGSTQLPGLVTAGLLLLASWIMDVGRKTTDEAERLRSDAELVV